MQPSNICGIDAGSRIPNSIVGFETHSAFALFTVFSLIFCTPLIVPDNMGKNAVINMTNTEQLLNVGKSASV